MRVLDVDWEKQVLEVSMLPALVSDSFGSSEFKTNAVVEGKVLLVKVQLIHFSSH